MDVFFGVLGPGGPPPAVERLRERLGWEGPEGGSGDRFDEGALHVVAWDAAGEIVAAARLVGDSPRGFPLEGRWPRLLPDLGVPGHELVEVSAVLLDGERAAGAGGVRATGPGVREEPAVREEAAALLFDLYREALRAAADLGKAVWCSVMDEGRWRLLTRLGLATHPYGDPWEAAGASRPCWNSLAAVPWGWAPPRPAARRPFPRVAEPGGRESPAGEAAAPEGEDRVTATFAEVLQRVASHPQKGARLVARTFYRQLRRAGLPDRDIMAIADDLLGGLTASLREYRLKKEVPVGRAEPPAPAGPTRRTSDEGR